MLEFSLMVAVHNIMEKEPFPLLNLSLTLSLSVFLDSSCESFLLESFLSEVIF